jgi:hypothetical protein
MAAKQGPNALFCVPNRTKRILLVSVLLRAPPRWPVPPLRGPGTAAPPAAPPRPCAALAATGAALAIDGDRLPSRKAKRPDRSNNVKGRPRSQSCLNCWHGKQPATKKCFRAQLETRGSMD